MNKLLVIIFIFTISLFGEDINATVEDTNIVVQTAVESIDENLTQDDKNITQTDEQNLTELSKNIVQLPKITQTNIDAKQDDDIIVQGTAQFENNVTIIIKDDDNYRVTFIKEVDDTNSWQVYKSDFDKPLPDGKYSIYVTANDKFGNKSEMVSIDNLVRDTQVSAIVNISDGDEKQSNELINIAELDSFYILGQIDEDAKIDKLYITDNNDETQDIQIDTQNINLDTNGKFEIKGIDITSLKDGAIEVVLKVSDEHNNTAITKGSIFKDTTPPSVPEVLQSVREGNMQYGIIKKEIVFKGHAELGATIIIQIYNKNNLENGTGSKVLVDNTNTWIALGKDFKIKEIEDGDIEVKLVQIDRAGNASKPLFLQFFKKRTDVFPKTVVEIAPEDYIPVFTVKDNIVDAPRSIVVSDKEVIFATFEFVQFYDKKECKNTRNLEIKGVWVNSIKLDKNLLYVGLANGEIRVYDIDTLKLLNKIKAHKMATLRLALNSKYLVSSSADGTIAVRNKKDLTLLYTLKNHQWNVGAIALDNDILYSGSDDYSIKKWDLLTGKLIKSLKSAHDGTINDLVVIDNRLYSASDDKTIKIRDTKTGDLIKTLKAHKKSVNRLTFDKNMLISASDDRSIILWDIKTFKKIKRLKGHSKRILSLAVNSHLIVSGANDYTLRVWGYDESLKDDAVVDEADLSIYTLIKSFELSPDVVTSLAQTENELVIGTYGYVLFYNKVNYEFTRSYTTLDEIVGDETEATDESDDEDEGEEEDDEEDDEEELSIEDLLIKKLQQRDEIAKANLQWINVLKVSGIKLIAGLGYKNIKIWDLEKNDAIALLEGHESGIKSLYVDESIYVSGDAKGVVNIWDIESNEAINTIEAHQWDVRGVAVAEDKLITASDDYSIRIWDMESGDIIKEIKAAHNDIITHIEVVEDTIISSSLDGTIKYRDIETGKLLKTLKGHTGGINTFVVDENHIVSASKDKTLRVWDIKTGKLITTLKDGHSASITAILITDDYIISGGEDKIITIWKYYE
jgi:WD40 repeat protein